MSNECWYAIKQRSEENKKNCIWMHSSTEIDVYIFCSLWETGFHLIYC